MAMLANDPYPLPPLDFSDYSADSPHEKAFTELLEKSDALPEGEIVGAVVQFPVADGSASYLVTREKPLIVQHIPYGDGYRVLDPMIRGLRASDIRTMMDSARRMRALFRR